MVEIVAEFTTNHFGHMGLLHRMVEAAAQARASCIKMQMKDVATFYTPEKLARHFESPFGATYQEYRQQFELADDADWRGLDIWCMDADLSWFVTPQDIASLASLVPRLQAGAGRGRMMRRVKVASSNVCNTALLNCIGYLVPTDHEIVVSVGGATLSEIEAIVKRFEHYKRLYLLHCVAEYPCPAERLRLGNIADLQRHFGSEQVLIGYSGHEVGFAPTLAAAKLGAVMIERHFCISRASFVHHIECSLEPPEFAEMVRQVQAGQEPPPLPPEAYRSEFGMSDAEKRFLVEQTYGDQFLGMRAKVPE